MKISTESLAEKLRALGESDMYPFHMPGHKRNREWAEAYSSPFSSDITETEGFDNLHHPEGILRDAMEAAASLYGTKRTWFLVNGSTCGILAALSAAALPEERILMAENSHRSAFHGLVLRNLVPVFARPRIIPEYGIAGEIRPADVDRLLEEEARKGGRIRAVYVTSPTYEGVLSDIRGIAGAAHRHGIPLIVDEAHGAHLVFGKSFGESAVLCGADVVVQSVHKTLPSLTQTAVLHLCPGGEKYFSPDTLERWLRVYESSSPSYILMASIDSCLRYMGSPEGVRAMERYEENLRKLRQDLGKLDHIRLLAGENIEPSRLVLFPEKAGGMTGKALADMLRLRYHLETEMACRDYLILMTSLMDTPEGFMRLVKALRELDGEMDASPERNETGGPCGVSGAEETGPSQVPAVSRNTRVMGLSEAWNAPREWIPAGLAAGRICGDFLTLYPPGVPMALPGDRITEEMISCILENRRLGLTVDGTREAGNPEENRGEDGGERSTLVPVLRSGREAEMEISS